MAVFPVNDDKTMAFQCMVRKLEDFCKDLPLDLYVSYMYDISMDVDEYYVNISDIDDIKSRIRFKYYPKTDIYDILYPYFFKGKPDYASALNKTYSPTNCDTEIKSVNDIYEMIIKYIKKGISSYEG